MPKGRVRQAVQHLNYKYHETLHKWGVRFWALLLVLFLLGMLFFVYIEDIVHFAVLDYGYIGILVSTFILDMTMAPIAAEVPLFFAVISNLNGWYSLLAVEIGSLLAIGATYYIGKKLGAPGIEKIVGQKNFQKIIKQQKYGKIAVLIGALTPVPYVPYLAGLWNFDTKDMLIYLIVPRLFRFLLSYLLFTYIGVQVVEVFIH